MKQLFGLGTYSHDVLAKGNGARNQMFYQLDVLLLYMKEKCLKNCNLANIICTWFIDIYLPKTI